MTRRSRLATRRGTAPRTAVVIAVLANDRDVEGNPLVVTAAGPAGNGTVVRNANGSITYTPRDKVRRN